MSGVTIIAGNGVFPRLVAEGARRKGIKVGMVSLIGEASPETENAADDVGRIHVGQVGGMLKYLKKFGNKNVVFAGGVNKVGLLTGARPDFEAIKLFARLRDKKDDSLLKAVALFIEKNGFSVVAGTEFCPGIVVGLGAMTGRMPAKVEVGDAEYGLRVLAALSPFSTGQSVLVKKGTVLAIETAEGTDSAIKRVREMKIKGAVLVKAAKIGQARRFDTPAIGPATVAACARAGVRAIFLGAGAAMLLGVEETLSAADREGISITGI